MITKTPEHLSFSNNLNKKKGFRGREKVDRPQVKDSNSTHAKGITMSITKFNHMRKVIS